MYTLSKPSRIALFLFILFVCIVLTSATLAETMVSNTLALKGENYLSEETSREPFLLTTEKELESETARSLLGERIATEKQIYKKPFVVSLHRPNYFLGITYNDHPNRKVYESVGINEPKQYEAKYQLSLRMLVWSDIFYGKGDLYAAYTQLSLWQIYSYSSPFRETNYEPELLLSFDTEFNVLGLTNRLFIIGLNHQSNGMGPVLSRSWNRIYMEFIAERGNFFTGLKSWYRIPEDEEEDDNPDIEDYLGYGQLFGAYKYKKNVFSFMLRNNLQFDENRGALEIGWSYPLKNNLRIYCQYLNGYGESLVDYNVLTRRISIGVMINDWI